MFNKLLDTIKSIYEIYRRTKPSKIPICLVIAGLAALFPSLQVLIAEYIFGAVVGQAPSKNQLNFVALLIVFLGVTVHLIELIFKNRKEYRVQKKQTQTGGDASINIQVGENLIIEKENKKSE